MSIKRILLTLLFCVTFTGLSELKTFPSKNIVETEDTTFLYGELNDSTLYLALEYYNIKHPKIVLAQAKLETGNYTSRHCIKGNNLFGLYNSRKKRYFQFKHWTHSIQAYKDMIEYKHRDGEDYYAFLTRIKYASDPTYIHKVKQIERKLKI